MKPLVPVSRARKVALGIAFFLVFVAAWSFATFGGFVSKTFLADPLTMLEEGWALFAKHGFALDVGVTVWRVLGGFVLAAIVGVPLGIAMGLLVIGMVFIDNLWVAVPLLILLLDLDPVSATGLALGVVAASAIFGSIARIRHREILWIPALFLGIDVENLHLDPVTDLERFVYGDNCSTEKIRKDILGGQGKSNSCNSCPCKERGNINIEICEEQEEYHKPDQVSDHDQKDRYKPVEIRLRPFCYHGTVRLDEILAKDRDDPRREQDKHGIDHLTGTEPAEGFGNNLKTGQGEIE